VSVSACATSTRSKTFYDAALAQLGYKCIRAARTLAGYGNGPDSISFWVVAAERPVPADEKSGLHFCFAAPDAAGVDAFHATQAGVTAHRSAADVRRRLLCRLYHRSGRIPDRGILRPGREVTAEIRQSSGHLCQGCSSY